MPLPCLLQAAVQSGGDIQAADMALLLPKRWADFLRAPQTSSSSGARKR